MKSKIIRIIEYPFRISLSLPRLTAYSVRSLFSRLVKPKSCYFCPICGYFGRFKSKTPETGERINALCPKCGSCERHRLQYLVFKELTKCMDTKKMSMLHFAAEYFFVASFRAIFKTYITADLNAPKANVRVDLTCLSFRDNTFDVVYASHVVEHIKDDRAALSEMKRVLKPGGIAIIPVPIIGKNTIEYGQSNPDEYDHVRCPGEDYFERYRGFFSKVKLYKSTDFDERFQLYVYENRSVWPETMPLRPSEPGEKHLDYVPVCFK
jgi:SAM-dependent methyltransferase